MERCDPKVNNRTGSDACKMGVSGGDWNWTLKILSIPMANNTSNVDQVIFRPHLSVISNLKMIVLILQCQSK